MKTMSRLYLPTLVVSCFAAISTFSAPMADALEQEFQSPPDSAKPWTWWHWMNGNVTEEGITADLEAMQRVGIAGLYNFHAGTIPIPGDITFLSPEWWNLMRFSVEEGDRLGLQMGFHNCPGWSSSGGPWMEVEDSMQTVVWSETKWTGKAKTILPRPEVDSEWNYYQDIAVYALPDTTNAIPTKSVINLTGEMNAEGRLNWKAPRGEWTILRMGHTTTGKKNAPPPFGGAGLEVDKMRKDALDKHFAAYPAKIVENAGAAKRALRTIEIDSYEMGDQNWTPAFAEEFKKRRGYDPMPWLPIIADRTLENAEITSRVQYDMKQTIADLFADNYYGHFTELVNQYPWMYSTVEPYSNHTPPFDSLTVGGRADVVMAEFWRQPCKWGWRTLPIVASVAHTMGMPIASAEALTGWPHHAQWRQDPYALKASGDQAFCLGINRLVLHTYAHQPWAEDVNPGMTMGWWGTHFSRTQTWWEQSPAWFAYLNRCQYLLQQGRFVGDVLLLDQEHINVPAGFAGDGVSVENFLANVQVKDGRLMFPHGASYRVLVLPYQKTMTPAVARKIEELADDGAIIIGPRPERSPSLVDYPTADETVRDIADELWGKGKVSTQPLAKVLAEEGIIPDFTCAEPDVLWIHRRTDDADIYFVSNQQEQERIIECSFRVSGKQPELWDAASGEIRDAGTYRIADGLTRLPLKMDPSGSVFVVFRQNTKKMDSTKPANWRTFKPVQEITGSWTLRFDPKWGGPAQIQFDQLQDWSTRPEPGIRYYSGAVTYDKTFELKGTETGNSLWLDLGDVKNLAEVELNGKSLGILWKPPFRIDISRAAQPGKNHLKLKIVNLWPNRLIGDEQEPEDMKWGPVRPWKHSGPQDKSTGGRALEELPEWFIKGTPRPSSGRYTFTTWNFYEKDSPLMPSGLLGPVRVMTTKD